MSSKAMMPLPAALTRQRRAFVSCRENAQALRLGRMAGVSRSLKLLAKYDLALQVGTHRRIGHPASVWKATPKGMIMSAERSVRRVVQAEPVSVEVAA